LRPPRLFVWLPPVAWALLIGYLLTASFEVEPEPWMFPHLDKIIHIILFATLAWLLWPAWHTRLTGHRSAAVWLSFLIAALYGAATEYLQTLLPDRHGNLWDAAANTLGAATVWWAPRLWAKTGVRLYRLPLR
jgi:VanZ family protein